MYVLKNPALSNSSIEPPNKKQRVITSTNMQGDAKALINRFMLQNQDRKDLRSLSLQGYWPKNHQVQAQTQAHTEPFGDFFQRWLLDEERGLAELRSAAAELTWSEDEPGDQNLNEAVNRAMCHYEDYYRVKSESVEQDVLQMLSAPWLSPLEQAFLWIGGWRPTTVFHLLYSATGLQFEVQLTEFLQGLSSLSDDRMTITPSQLVSVDELQKQTVRKERELTETMASLQETLADSCMVELTHSATQLLLGVPSDGREASRRKMAEQVKSQLRIKEDKLKEVCRKADILRLQTFKSVVGILNPFQATNFLIAAAELHLRLHDWGVCNYNHPSDVAVIK